MDTAEPRSSTSSKRSSAISSSDVQSILTQSTTPVAQPSPKEHISKSRPSSFHAVNASQSIAQAFPTSSSIPASQPVVRSNRFSLTFPILPPSKETSPVRRSISPSRDTLSPTVELPADPSDGNFLTAIAAQERRVLEIKEELQRAEADLDRLKLLWASHEAQKKKSEAKKVTKLRPLSVALPSTSTEEHGSVSTWSQQQQEMERRRLLLANGQRTSRGKVFSGSRHTRTLSLLNPMQKETPESASALSRPRCDTSPDRALPHPPATSRPGALARASTTPDLTVQATRNVDLKLDLSELGIDRDMVLNTGKKMAMGIKDGLWTFWEDLRQATVGEEAAAAAAQSVPTPGLRPSSSSQTLRSPRRMSSKRSLRGSSRGSTSSRNSVVSPSSSTEKRSSPTKPTHLPPLLDLADSAATVTEAQSSPSRTPTTSKRAAKHTKTPSVAVSTASSDAWDGWDDSPGYSRSSSATSNSTSQQLSPVADMQGTPSKTQRSPTTVSTHDPLPWPAIGKLGGATLRRTASHLMSEWDKLNPPDKSEAKEPVDDGAGARSYKQDTVKQD